MAKDDLQKKLGGRRHVPTWEDQIQRSKPERKRKTYIISTDVHDAVKTRAAMEQTEIGFLVEFLLHHGLSQLETGELEVTKEWNGEKFILVYSDKPE